MKFYIGLGGIGCRTLSQYHNCHIQDDDKKFYYVNTEQTITEDKNSYIIPYVTSGTGTRRCIGRNIVNFEIYSGSMPDFFEEIKKAESVELVFSLSSFGGFGGAAVLPLIDFLEAISWERLKSCIVIAFNENAHIKWGFPESLIHRFQENTIEFTTELLTREQEYSSSYYMGKLFNPGCTSYLIDTRDMLVDEFWKCFEYADDALKKLDCKGMYRIKQSKQKPDVFISYSSKDQVIADKIVDRLNHNGLATWIATRDIKEGSYAKQIIQAIREAEVFLVVISKNSIASEQVKNEIDRAFNRIKDGMKIIPFIIDDSEMDDECQYYLCRQEMFFGETPPIDDRINELVTRVQEILN